MNTYKLQIGDKTLEAHFTDLAKQTNGSVLMRMGDTMVLVTAVMGSRDRFDIDYFPLTVEYEEKYYAAGKIYGSRFVRRESRPSEHAVLSGRAIDRSLRPRFNHHMRRDVQVVATVLSMDQEDPVTLAIIGASLALTTSDIAWNGPLAAVRINKKGGEILLNSDFEKRLGSELDLLISGSGDRINMVECGAKQITEDEILKNIKDGHELIKKICAWQKEVIAKEQKEKLNIPLAELPSEKINSIREKASDKLNTAIYAKTKEEYTTNMQALKKELAESLTQENWTAEEIKLSGQILEELITELVHKNVIENDKRIDGRKLDEIRPLEMQAGFLPRTHGSAIFKRGETHALSVITLGAPSDVLTIQGMEITGEKKFLHHYNFPPYSTGETGFFRGPGRREIGHGALAEKSLVPIIPDEENFPYTIRVVSEIMSSNGSSSMASVCGSTLALMDAGVPIKAPAAGISIGLMNNNQGDYKLITDITGMEDHYGDMDFKVAGTSTGITGIQTDVKIGGLTMEIIEKTLQQAKKARMAILKEIENTLSEPRKELSPFAPRIITFMINPDKIREVIGPGGKVINEIIAKTGVNIDLEDDGKIFITSPNEVAAQKALDWIKNITKEFKVGEIMNGKVRRIAEFGAFVELTPGQDALLHVSEISTRRVEHVSDVLKIGDIIPVKIIRIDESGRIAVSAKAAMNQEANPQ